MQTRLIKLRFRRRLRKGQRQVEDLGLQAERQIEKHLFKRFERLAPIRRFLMGWIGLMLLLTSALVAQNFSLSKYYQTLRPAPGGIYNEGVRGRFTNANPIYATSDADATLSRLVFAGLLKYDQQGRLVGDLASGYTVDPRGTTYTVRLKPNLKWQDGQVLTSEDVAFTYQLIQNPDARSPLQGSWQGVTVSAPDARTVVFKLPGPLASFPYNLTNGIVPKHVLANIPVSDLRSADFNTLHPVGAGPFAWQALSVSNDSNPDDTQVQIALTPFAGYTGGAPKLQKLVVHVFASQNQLISSFSRGQLTGAEGLNEVPAKLANDHSVVRHDLPLRAAKMVFFKTSGGVLASQTVRHALVEGTDTDSIISHLDYSVRAVKEPILTGQTGYDRSLAQPSFNQGAAMAELLTDGWKAGKNGILNKDGKPLMFTLTVASDPENQSVAGELQSQWQKLGVKLSVQVLDANEFQNALTTHSYEAILNGIAIGSDPDVFVYWDSSQADIRSANRLNLSEYKNPTADTALEAGRTRLDPALRTIKYKPFLQAWQHDSPALGLYQPRLLYLTRGQVYGLNDHPVNTPTDRLINVENWEIHETRVTNP